jgi:hypothetical protein
MATRKVRKQYPIFKGNTGPVIPLRPLILGEKQDLDVNWTCQIALLDSSAVPVVAARAVTTKNQDNQAFLAALTPAETASVTLDVGKDFTSFTQVMVVENTTTTPPYKVERRVTLQIKPEGI